MTNLEFYSKKIVRDMNTAFMYKDWPHGIILNNKNGNNQTEYKQGDKIITKIQIMKYYKGIKSACLKNISIHCHEKDLWC